jgi:signal transduction histidine kinase/CheY-like chemotaxis protein
MIQSNIFIISLLSAFVVVALTASVILAWSLYNQRKKFHVLSLQIAQVLEQSRGVESISSLDVGPWIETCVRDSHQIWGRAFLSAAYANLAKFLPSISVLFAVDTDNKEEQLPKFVAGNIEPVLELILCELLSHDKKAMRKAPVELNRFGISDHKTQIFEVISGVTLTVWIGSKRNLSNDTWDQIVRYIAEIQRLFAILILKRRAKDTTYRKDSQLMLQQVSHDIRSPLHNMKSALILAEESKDQDISDYLHVALKNLDSISELTETILDYSSVSSGVVESVPEVIELDSLVQDLVQRYSIAASLKNIELTYDSIFPFAVSFDKRHLDRVLSNLISNAIKYSSKGKINISATLIDADSVSIQISDQGIGLTSEQLERLFTPFTRFQRHLAPGAGLGLSFAKQLVELNGGSLKVTSDFGQGSVFSVTARKAAKITKQEQSQLAPKSLKGIRVLIIEDNQDLRNSLERSLKHEQLEVFSSQNFIEAQSILQYQNVDCIISDLETGQGSLEEFLADGYFQKTSTPVLLLSGSQLTVVPQGIHSMVRKPVEFAAITAWIESVIEPEDSQKTSKFKELAA